MTKDEALKMAIDLLELYNNHIYRTGNGNDVIKACKEALEQKEIGDAEIKQMLNDIAYYQKRVEELEQPAQECEWCKSREVNFDMDEPEDPLCKICGKGLGSTKECAWTGCPLNWSHEETKDE
jgi:type I site-specific restriction-modification system R (restriction) subunit